MQDSARNEGEEGNPLRRNLLLVFSYLAIMVLIAVVYS